SAGRRGEFLAGDDQRQRNFDAHGHPRQHHARGDVHADHHRYQRQPHAFHHQHPGGFDSLRFLYFHFSFVANGDRGKLHHLHRDGRSAEWIYRNGDSRCQWVTDGRHGEFLAGYDQRQRNFDAHGHHRDLHARGDLHAHHHWYQRQSHAFHHCYIGGLGCLRFLYFRFSFI